MSDNRVQKLLFSEYCDFEDMVLIESPFAQTTKEGQGIRQVHIGLTPSKLVLATDVLPPAEYVNFKYCPGVDPLIETFELIAIYPVECVNLSIYRTKRNQALKARFCNNKVLYFELGGFENRAMFWNLWCEKVKFFCPDGTSSSRSETSVGTSTTESTLYLLDRKFVAVNGIKQLWYTFGPNPSLENSSANETINSRVRSRWTDRHLYLGKEFEQLRYVPVMEPPSLEEFILTKSSKSSKLGIRNKRSEIISYMDENNLSIGDSVQINRFGSGVKEGCNTGLFLTADNYIVPRQYSRVLEEDAAREASIGSFSYLVNFEHLAETAVLSWELYRASDPNKYKIKHKRRYGLSTQPSLLYGFGPFDTPKGCKFSLQIKRAVSEVSLSRFSQNFKASLPKKQLTASVSHQHLTTMPQSEYSRNLSVDKLPFTYFWTPGYNYRPKTAKQVYEERLRELRNIEQYLESLKMKRKRKRKRSKFGRNLLCLYHNKIPKFTTDEDSNEEVFYTKKQKKGFIHSLFPYPVDSNNLNFNRPNETPFQCFKRLLKVDKNICAWQFDSITLAQQLTMIDKQLFLKIPTIELDILLWQQSSRSTPNISSILAFSKRITNLVAHEILKNDCVKARARLISRFINVADKCHKISNFQSCKSVMNGLQSPAIFRLRSTWAYLRKKHASKYRNFEFLCRFYRDCRMISYQRTFFVISHAPPFLPYIGDIFNRLLGKIPDYHFPSKMSTARSFGTVTSKSYEMDNVPETKISLFHRLLKALALSQTNEVRENSNRARKKHLFQKKKAKFKGLYEYYKPSDYYDETKEDNLLETKAFLERCQVGAINYNFRRDEMARCYLLKARYQDDRENFVFSLSVESPRNYYTNQNHNKM